MKKPARPSAGAAGAEIENKTNTDRSFSTPRPGRQISPDAGSDPLAFRDDGGGWHHIGEIADGVVHRIGRQAISFHLSRAAETTGPEALMALAEADAIRRSLGLSWSQYVAGLDISAREAA